MNSDAVLACFFAGASLDDLSAALDVERGTLEQMLRESCRPRRVVDLAVTPRELTSGPEPHGTTAPTNGQAQPKRKTSPARQTHHAIRAAILTTLRRATEPLPLRALKVNGRDVSYHLAQLVRDGLVLAEGATSSRRFRIAPSAETA